jgi:hypothetical protein
MASSLGGQRKWVHCKHIYCILQHVMFCEHTKKIIHRLTWSWNEVRCFTSCEKQIDFCLV